MSNKPQRRSISNLPKTGVGAYLLAALCVVIAFIIRSALEPLWGDRLPFATFFLAELVVALVAPGGPFVFVLLVGFILADWFFIQPRHSLIIGELVNQVNAAAFFFLGFVVLLFSSRAHKSSARERAAQDELLEALSNVKVLEGLLPICSSCKKIRDNKGLWNQLEIFIRNNSGAEFTHSICPDCIKRIYPEFCDETEPAFGAQDKMIMTKESSPHPIH